MIDGLYKAKLFPRPRLLRRELCGRNTSKSYHAIEKISSTRCGNSCVMHSPCIRVCGAQTLVWLATFWMQVTPIVLYRMRKSNLFIITYMIWYS